MHFLLLEKAEEHGFVEVLLHFFKQMHLGLGLGGPLPRGSTDPHPEGPCGAGTARPAAGWAALRTGREKNVHFCASELEIMYTQ